MKILKKKFLTYTLAAGALLGVQSCKDDILTEITELNVSRLFSPVGIEARIVNQTSVRLNWSKVDKATSYNIEVYEGNDAATVSGTPAVSLTGITMEEVPYTIPNLGGETEYVIRLKAVGANLSDSKWSSALIKTDAEQLFSPVSPEDVAATTVTLRWTPGQAATKIVLTPGNKEHTITPAEITAGAATVTGLTPETAYTAKLMRGTATRGTATFTTLIDLGGAIAVNPGDDITALFQNAKAGDIFALLPGTYPSGDIIVSKSISIKGARPADKPILKGTVFRIEGGASLELKDVVLDGTGSLDGNQTIIYAAGTYGKLAIDGSEIKNYVKGALYVNTAAHIETVAITNTIYSNIEGNGGDFIDFRNGIAGKFDFINNTVYNSALARDFFRMDAGGSTNFPAVKSIITIRNNTFNNVSNGNNRRILYIRLASNEITFEKNILSNTEGYFTNQAATNIVKMDKNNYFNAPNFTGSTQANTKNDATGTHTSLNPGYANAATGNFTVSNEDLKFQQIGDPRWLK
jgi:hypothetical protein